MKKLQKGFTLIELMVVIVIIGILAALAIPRMFGVSNKAKFSEAPTVLASWETLQSASAQETGAAGTFATIGFQNPNSGWWLYTDGTTLITADVVAMMDFGNCDAGDDIMSTFALATDTYTHGTSDATCSAYGPNFMVP